MDEYILVAVLAIIVMLFFAVFVIRNVIRRINENSKKYFMDKLQEYDFLIDEKKEQLESLQQEINTLEDRKKMQEELEEYRKNKEELEAKILESTSTKDKNNDDIVYDIPNPKYRPEDFFSNYKKIKKEFNVNSRKILEDFIEEHKNDNEKTEYKEFKKIRSYFDQNTTYQVVTLGSKEQYELVEKTLNEGQRKIAKLEKYNKNKFSILKFIDDIEKKIKETDPNIYVYVSSDEINYDSMGENVKTLVYKNMSEGIIIQYHNKMYDYSI